MTTASFVAMSVFQVSVPSVMFAALAVGVLIEIVRRRRAAVSPQKSDEPIQSNGRQRRFPPARASFCGAHSRHQRRSLDVAIGGTLLPHFGVPLLGDTHPLLHQGCLCHHRRLLYSSSLYRAERGSEAALAVEPEHGRRLCSRRDDAWTAIIVVAYVGFMAGYHHFHQSLWLASVALLLTTFYTFLPCFFLLCFLARPSTIRWRTIWQSNASCAWLRQW